jgi:predicted Zn-dependent peptidase
LRCLRGDAARLFGLAADCLLHASFPGEEMEAALDQALARSAEEEESLARLNAKALRPALYPSHPYGREPWGTPQSLEKITAADLRRLHAAWVRPEHIAVAFVGDCTVEGAADLARKHLRWRGPPKPFTPPATPLAGIGGRKQVEREAEGVGGVALAVAFRGARPGADDRDRLDLLDALLGGLAGRLFVEVRDKQGLAYDVSSSHVPLLDGGSFTLYVQTDPTKAQRCLDTLFEEVRKLRDQAPPPDEVRDVQSYLVGQIAIGMQQQGDVAARLASAELLGRGAEWLFSRPQRLQRLTPQDLQDAARRLLDPAACAIAIVRPKP